MDVQPFSRSRSGYSLIEVMIALVVLSIGMLGIAGLTVGALKDTRGAFNRTKAVAFAWDMAERIRANRTAGAAYAGAGANGNCFATASVTAPSSCNSATLAAHDIFEWQAALADTERGLPSGTGTVTFNNATTPPTYIITVQWSDGRTAPPDDNAPAVTVVTQP
ncbi:MAG TPA: type IV pilus modification protein PilV [Gammaproteobacteria bacterium]